MSSETQILDKIKTDLSFLMESGIGYTNRLSKVTEGWMPLAVDGSFDCAYFFLGNRTPERFTNDNKPCQWSADLWIFIQMRASEGKLSRKIESWIDDMRKWLYQGSGVTSGKWYTLDTSLPDIVPYGGKVLKAIEPNSIWDKHISELIFKININYST